MRRIDSSDHKPIHKDGTQLSFDLTLKLAGEGNLYVQMQKVICSARIGDWITAYTRDGCAGSSAGDARTEFDQRLWHI